MDTMPAEQFRTGKFITVGLRNQIRKAEEAGYKIPVARTILITGIKDDEIWVNMSRVSGVDATSRKAIRTARWRAASRFTSWNAT